MVSISSDAQIALEATKLEPDRRFTIGSSDYSSFVSKWPTIKRKHDDLAPVSISLNCANGEGTFNFFKTDKITLITSANISLGIVTNNVFVDVTTTVHEQNFHFHSQNIVPGSAGSAWLSIGVVSAFNQTVFDPLSGSDGQYIQAGSSSNTFEVHGVDTSSSMNRSSDLNMGAIHNYSVFAKTFSNSNISRIALINHGETNPENESQGADFHIFSMSVGSVFASATSAYVDSNYANGWVRYGVDIGMSARANLGTRMLIIFGANSNYYEQYSDTVDKVGLFGAQVTSGPGMQTYVVTTDSPIDSSSVTTIGSEYVSTIYSLSLDTTFFNRALPSIADDYNTFNLSITSNGEASPTGQQSYLVEVSSTVLPSSFGHITAVSSDFQTISRREDQFYNISGFFKYAGSGQLQYLRIMDGPITDFSSEYLGDFHIQSGTALNGGVNSVTSYVEASSNGWVRFGVDLKNDNDQTTQFDARFRFATTSGDFFTPITSASVFMTSPQITKSTSMQAYTSSIGPELVTAVSTTSVEVNTEIASPDIFVGKVSKVNYSRNKVNIQLTDKLKMLSERLVGTSEEPVLFTSSNYLPSDVALWLATSYGGFSSVQSTSNVDIDWIDFQAWAAIFSGDSVFINARFEGLKVVTALRKIARMTDSAVHLKGNKLSFARYSLASSNVGQFADSTIKDLSYDIDDYRVVNRQHVFADYDISSDTYGVSVFDQSTSSVNSFGLREEVEKDKSIWYTTSATATNLAQRLITINKEPYGDVKVATLLNGLKSDIGDMMSIQDDSISVSETHRVTGTSINLDTGEIVLSGRTNQSLDGFVLDLSTLDGADILI